MNRAVVCSVRHAHVTREPLMAYIYTSRRSRQIVGVFVVVSLFVCLFLLLLLVCLLLFYIEYRNQPIIFKHKYVNMDSILIFVYLLSKFDWICLSSHQLA